MLSEILFPMASANSVPRTVRNYHYEHFPPPSDSVELAAELRRGLRGVPHGGFWDKVKSAGWRLLLKFDSRIEQPLRRPDFPVAPPSSPRTVPRARKITPDIHIHPVGCPDFLLSPPRPQEDGFLFIPPRLSRSSRSRRQERLPPSSRPLPTPPGPPTLPVPKITCCPWANGPSTPSLASTPTSASSLSVDSNMDPEDLEPEHARFFAEIMPFLFFPDQENDSDSNHDDKKSRDLGIPEPSVVAESGNRVSPVPQNDDMAMSSSQTEEIRHAAADRQFLEDLGLTPLAFMALLDGTGIEWDEDEDEDEDEGDGDEDGDEDED